MFLVQSAIRDYVRAAHGGRTRYLHIFLTAQVLCAPCSKLMLSFFFLKSGHTVQMEGGRITCTPFWLLWWLDQPSWWVMCIFVIQFFLSRFFFMLVLTSGVCNRINNERREVIALDPRHTNNKGHNNRDLNRLRQLTPCMRVSTRYITGYQNLLFAKLVPCGCQY